MFYLTLFLLCVSTSAEISEISEEFEGYQPKIINGYIAFIENYPYLVSIRLYGNHLCGGAILDETTILTAAHCMKVAKYFPFNWFLTIQAGVSNLDEGGQVITVSNIYDHAGYESVDSDYDIAVLKLRYKLQFNYKVKPVKLPTGPPPVGVMANAAGWGRTKQNGEMSRMLYAVQLPVLDFTTCKNSYPREKFTSRMMCAGYLEGGKDTCQGDSGGPLVVNNTVIGIVSWGYGCGLEGYPGVFADVSQLLDYIRQVR